MTSAQDAARGREAILSLGWLSRVPRDFADAVLAQAHWRTTSPGDAIITAGRDGGLCGIAIGQAEVANAVMPADVQRLHLVSTGFWAGYRTLVMQEHLQLSIIARTELLWAQVPLHAMQRLLQQQPHWWQHIAILSELNAKLAVNAWADLTHPSSEFRAIGVILRLANCRFSDTEDTSLLTIRASHGELATMAVMTRNTLSLILKTLEDNGIIRLGYRSIILLQPARLRARLDEI